MNQNYDNYDECVESELRNSLIQPVDNADLYAKRLYDSQLARDACYKKRPIQIEGFWSENNNTFKTIIGVLISIIAVILIIMLIYSLCKHNNGETIGSTKTIKIFVPHEPLTASN